eukprot:1176468-Amphidinium_carterae.2
MDVAAAPLDAPAEIPLIDVVAAPLDALAETPLLDVDAPDVWDATRNLFNFAGSRWWRACFLST